MAVFFRPQTFFNFFSTSTQISQKTRYNRAMPSTVRSRNKRRIKITADGKFPTWVKTGARAMSSIHGPGHVTYTSGVYIGFHFDDNRRNKMTDCWYSNETGDGRFTSGFGIDELTPEKGEMK